MADQSLQADKPYLQDIPGLAEAVGGVAPSSNHRSLIAALRLVSGLDGARLATWHGDRWLVRRKVLDRHGTVVAESHEDWLRVQLACDAGDASKTGSGEQWNEKPG